MAELIESRTYNFIKKETMAQVFSCEFCKISKSNFFYRTPLVTASDGWNWVLSSMNTAYHLNRKHWFLNPFSFSGG